MQRKINNMDAAAIRKELKQVRASLTEEYRKNASNVISERFIQWRNEHGTDLPYIGFASFGTEVSLWEVYAQIWATGKEVYFPVTEKHHNMTFYPVKGKEEMHPGTWDILEPTERRDPYLDQEGPAIVIVPGLAFDRQGHRIGYGGGYYDYFLSKHPNATKVAVAFHDQLIHEIQPQEWDIPVDYIITEKEVITINKK